MGTRVGRVWQGIESGDRLVDPVLVKTGKQVFDVIHILRGQYGRSICHRTEEINDRSLRQK